MDTTTSIAPAVMPILSAGRHRTPSRGACFMEYASYLAGERWSDHPECTHPLLAALARDVNDLVSDAGRARLVPHIHRVVGLRPEDPRYWAEIAAIAARAAMPVVSFERQQALGAGLLSLERRVGDPRLSRIVQDAFDAAPDTHRWATHFLVESPEARGDWRRAADAMTHTAAVGVALACVDDPDAILERMLVESIAAGEAHEQFAAYEASQATPREHALIDG